MPELQIGIQANAALVLPILLLANYLEHNAQTSNITRTFLDGNEVSRKESVVLFLDNGKILDIKATIDYLANLAIEYQPSQQQPHLREWTRRSESFIAMRFEDLQRPLDELNDHLTLRSYIVGHNLSVADLVIWGAIRGNRIAQSFIKKTSNNVSRWYRFIEVSQSWMSESIKEFISYGAKQRLAASAAGASYDIGMPSMDIPVVTRFPPEPSGYLHIGHAKAALLNDYYAHRTSKGKLICRFDDTNPSKESMEFQDAILEDLKMIGINPDKISYSSDYFQTMHDYALKLIKAGKAFSDDSPLGKGDEDRKNRLPSKRRDLSIEETVKHFAEMKMGSEEGRRWCLRARIAYDSPNGTLRDPVIYRCNLTPHHRTGTKWKMYPTYDFCAPILDSIEGVTLAFRTNEYRDRNAQYEWMQDALGLRRVKICDFSRLNFVRTVLSKRKLAKILDDGRVWGWDDPRMPTIRGILRRGMTVEALREFLEKQGPSANILNLEWGALWAINKQHIDFVAPRYTAVIQDHAVKCHIRGIDGPDEVTKPKHSKNPNLGSKLVKYDNSIFLEQVDAQTFAQDEEITLMSWGNAYVRDIIRDETDQIITGIELELHLEGDFKKTDKKITWLANTTVNLVPVDLVSFDHIITKDKLGKMDKLEAFINHNTEFRIEAYADCNVEKLSQGDIIQFERKGYYKLDKAYEGDGTRMVFFHIPS